MQMNVKATENPVALLPRLPLWEMFRLGLFQMALGVMSLLTLGVLNRLMIAELQIPAVLAAGVIAMSLVVAPARVWFGQLSDARPLGGYHRTGYVWLGAVLFSLMSYLALQGIWALDATVQAQGWGIPAALWVVLLGGLFGGYGLCLSLSSTPFAALLVDITDEDDRPRLIGVVWSMLMVGIVIGAILSSRLLDTPEVCGAALATFDPGSLGREENVAALRQAVDRLFQVVLVGVVGLVVISTAGIEKRYSRFGRREQQTSVESQGISLRQALKVLSRNRQTGIFFLFLVLMTTSLFMQDAVMEPYGGEVFGMCLAETTRLNAFFGIGTLIGIGGSGFVIIPRLGKAASVKWGCIGTMVCVLSFIAAGISGDPRFLQLALLGFGLASGLLTAAATNLMLDLTAAETAGTFIGAWGLAQAWARGGATLSGGAFLSLGRRLFDLPLLSYSLVFVIQASLMLIAIHLLRQVNVKEFQSRTRDLLHQVLAGEVEG
ncbi:MAG: BCD family MFS transporter [Thermostichales cyanobacterium SZTDM-1c_bins_54]